MNAPAPGRATSLALSGDWAARGACVTHPDPDLWFDHEGGSLERNAIAICGTCPVKAPCLDYALSDPGLSGVWGGTNPSMRTSIRNQARRHPAA